MSRLTNTLKALADPTRIRIVHLLRGRKELCVCEIIEALRLPQYTVSRHLGLLKEAGIIAGRRQGKWRHYSLNAAMSAEEEAIVAAVCECAAREPGAQQDVRCLEQHLRPRENGQVVDCPS